MGPLGSMTIDIVASSKRATFLAEAEHDRRLRRLLLPRPQKLAWPYVFRQTGHAQRSMRPAMPLLVVSRLDAEK